MHHFSSCILLEIVWQAYWREGKDAGLVFDIRMFDYGNHGDSLGLLASTYDRCPIGNSTKAFGVKGEMAGASIVESLAALQALE